MFHALRAMIQDPRATTRYQHRLANGTPIRRLKMLQGLRASVVNLSLLALTSYALWLGGDPTIVFSVGVAAFLFYNGLELSELASLMSAIDDAKNDDSDGK